MSAGRLYWVQRDGAVSEVPLTRDRLVIGRAKDADVRLGVSSVSGRHAAVVRTPNFISIEDLGSTNGTKVNGRKIDTIKLKHGDQIEIGTERLVYFTDASMPAGEFNRMSEAVTQRPALPKVPDTPETRPAPENAINVPSPNVADRLKSEPPTQVAIESSNSRATHYPVRASVTLLSGKLSGRKFPITKQTTTLGQEGLQVFQIVLREDAYWVVRGPNSSSPFVNGREAGERGTRLAHNDVVDLAGASVRFEIDPL